MSKLTHGSMPEGFPRDKVIQRKISNIQTATLLWYAAFIGFVIMALRSASSQ